KDIINAPDKMLAGREKRWSSPTKSFAICGPTNPINPMVPTKDTEPAVRMLTRNNEKKRKDPTFTPKLFALSSPKRSAVSFHADAKKNGIMDKIIMDRKRMFCQLALVNESKLQKMNC